MDQVSSERPPSLSLLQDVIEIEHRVIQAEILMNCALEQERWDDAELYRNAMRSAEVARDLILTVGNGRRSRC